MHQHCPAADMRCNRAERAVIKLALWIAKIGRRENAKRQIGEREIVPRRHVDPRGQVRVCHGAKVVHAGGFMR